MSKAKFDIFKCKTCKYHGSGAGHSTTPGDGFIHCNYSATGRTCLTVDNGQTIDRRGSDFYNCKLYEKGKAKRNEIVV